MASQVARQGHRNISKSAYVSPRIVTPKINSFPFEGDKGMDVSMTSTSVKPSVEITTREQELLQKIVKNLRTAAEEKDEYRKREKESAKAVVERIKQIQTQQGVSAHDLQQMLKAKDQKHRGGKFNAHGEEFYFDTKSCCCISEKSTLRKQIVWLITWSYFDHFISLVIVVNSILLGLTDYKGNLYEDYTSEHNQKLELIGMVLSIIFALECILKIVGMGFVIHENSYLRDSWNRLDFFVVAVSILDFVPALEQYSSLKILRTLRILRPLRSINKVKQMKSMINALLSSIMGLLNICGFLFFVLSIFGIFGVHQFMGHQYQRCRTTEEPTSLPEWETMGCSTKDADDYTCSTQFEWTIEDSDESQWLCTDASTCQYYLSNTDAFRDEPETSFYCGKPSDLGYPSQIDTTAAVDGLIFFDIVGFEDFMKAMLTVFVAITLEGWSLMMLNYMDAGSTWISPIFFISLVIFGAFFALNLVLAQVVESYYESQAAEDELMKEQEKKIRQKQQHDDAKQADKDNIKRQKTQEKAEQDAIPIETTRGLKEAFDVEEQEGQRNSQRSEEKNEQILINSETKLNSIKPLQKTGDPEVLHIKTEDSDKEKDEKQPSKENEKIQEIGPEELMELNAFQRQKNSCILRFFYEIVTSHQFNFFIFCLIIANTFVLASEGFPSTEAKQELLYQFNEFFTWIFFVEMIFKLIGIGPRNYMADSYNIFDAIVVTFSLIDWVIDKSVDQESLGSGAEALQALKALRLLRMIKLARSWSAMQEILGKMYLSLGDISFVFIILFLFIYIAALLGMEIFANYCRFTPNLDGELVTDVVEATRLGLPMEAPRENFDDTVSAVTTVFIVALGEDWPGIMYNYTRVFNYSPMIILYFIITYSIGNFMLLSLFTAVLLSRFEDNGDGDEDDEEEEEEDENESTKIEKPFWEKTKSFFRDVKVEYHEAFSLKSVYSKVAKEAEIEDKKAMKALERQQKKKPKSTEDDFDIKNTEPSTKQKLRMSVTQKSLPHLTSVVDTEKLTTSSQRAEKLKQNIKGNSLLCFGRENALRVKLYQMIFNPWFDRLILFFIVVSTIMLAIESPLDDPESNFVKVLGYIDYVMTAIFFCEMCVKIIALGFVANGKDSYIKNGWNVLDFLIVAASVFGVIFSEYELSFLKALRMLRILRPLRLISRNKSLKLAITSLINSIPDIVNLLIITTFFILMIAILCTTLLAGKFYGCQLDHLGLGFEFHDGLIQTKWDCANYGGEWVNPDLNFDTTPQSILTLMTIQTTEGWIGVMWASVDAVGVDMQPIRDYNRWYIIFYFILIVVICMLFLNLFVGIVCETYNKEKEQLTHVNLLTQEQRDWIQIQTKAYETKPLPSFEGAHQPCLVKLVFYPLFDMFIMFCIVVNTVLLAVQLYQMDEVYTAAFDSLNFVFIGIFTLEAILKIIAMGKKYFKDAWNVFDFIVVMVTFIVLIIKYIPSLQLDLSTQATIVRVLRVLRILRIVKRAEKLQIIFQTVLDAIPAMASLGVLLLLFLFLFSVIGMQLFSFVMLQSDLNRQFNFQTFTSSFLLLMRSATGEGWNALMFDTARSRSIDFQCDPNADQASTALNGGVTQGCGSPVAIAYFLIFLFVVCYIFLNLFIAIVVDTYSGMEAQYRLPIKPNDVDGFIKCWQKYDEDATGYIKTGDFSSFLKNLAESDTEFFTYNKEDMMNEKIRRNYIKNLEIPSHKVFTTYMFYDVLVLMCRDICMLAWYPKIRQQVIEKKIQKKADKLGFNLPPEEMTKFVRQEIFKNKDMQYLFGIQIGSIDEKDDKIELVNNLKEQSARIGKRHGNHVDFLKHAGGWQGVYSSKDIILVVEVQKRWKEYLVNKKNGLISSLAVKIDKTGQDTTSLQNYKGQITTPNCDNQDKQNESLYQPTIPDEDDEDLRNATTYKKGGSLTKSDSQPQNLGLLTSGVETQTMEDKKKKRSRSVIPRRFKNNSISDHLNQKL